MGVDTWIKLWVDGGWTMVPLFLVGTVIYVSAAILLMRLSRGGFQNVEDSVWMAWVRDPAQGEGKAGEIIRYTQDEAATLGQIQNRFAEVVSAELPEVDRRLAFVNVFISAAPLLGLFGTVLGMLTTFHGIAQGSGKMIDQIASGISEALITTEMGLLIALPGLVLSFMIRRKRNEQVAFLARLESYTLQHFRKSKLRSTPFESRKAADPAASLIAPPAARRGRFPGAPVPA